MQLSTTEKSELTAMTERNTHLRTTVSESFWPLAYEARGQMRSVASIDAEKGLRSTSTVRTQILWLVAAYTLLCALLLGMGTM